jgi:hypothetical protein
MIDELITETKSRHSSKPISQEVYSKWRSSAVTKRLFEELEIAVAESYQDPLPNDPNEALGQAKIREGYSSLVEDVLEWSPSGCINPKNKDMYDED